MTNINAYYPQRLKGWALGINAGGGNLGVPVVQLVGLLILATVGAGTRGCWSVIYIPLIIAGGGRLPRCKMNNLTADDEQQAAPCGTSARDRHTWIISLLYIGTFGSFIGFSFAFGQVLQVQFADIFSTPVKAAVPHVHRAADRVADPAGRRAAGRPVRRRPGCRSSTSSRWRSGPRWCWSRR